MRRKLDELQGILRGLTRGREHLLLVVSGTDIEMTYLLKALEGLEQGSPSDLYLIFPEPFPTAQQYIDAVIRRLRAQAEDAQAARAARGEPPWPPLPALCDEEGAPPHRRLRAAIDHVSSLMPPDGDHRVVWGLLPLQLEDREGYARLVAELIPWNGPEPWMKGLRFIARDDRARPFILPGLRKRRAPGVLLYQPDLSTPALTDALARDAADRSLPVAERMEALTQLAALDGAHRRYPQAIEKYGVLYTYYGEHRAPAMQAVVLQGVGDLLRRTGDPRGAKQKYQQGLAHALEAEALPIILNLAFAVGEVSLELREHAEADGFFDLAQRIAGALLNAPARAECLEKQAMARWKAGDHEGADLLRKEARA